jgi:dTMP kinase
MVSNPRGLFISFEGIDGAGKTTHIESVARLFEEQGRTVVRTREPGGTPLAEQLRERILNDDMDALTEALLVFAARRDHIQHVIQPALAKGAVVLSDRFTDASFAYQGAGRGFDLATLATLEQWVQTQEGLGLLQPDLTFWFDLPPAVAAERLSKARVADRFEQQDLAFFERVANGYAQRQAAAPARIVRLDAHQERHQVWRQITHRLVQKGWLAIMTANNFKLTS